MELTEAFMTLMLVAIPSIVGAIVSVALEVIPGMKERWSEWVWKPLTLLTLFLLVPCVAWALGCFANIQLLQLGLGCDAEGGVWAFLLGFIGFLSNQATFAVATRRSRNARLRNSWQ